jgi:hypothetical protein
MNIYIHKISDIAKPNKYTKWYINICESAYIRTRNKKDAKLLFSNIETHHILPKSFKLGGIKDKDNLIHLSLREHFICHWLLSKMFTGAYNQKMNYAIICLGNGKTTMTSIQYKANVTARKLRGATTLGLVHTEETKDKIRNKKLGVSNIRQPHSEETKAKLRKPKPSHCRGKLSQEDYDNRNYKNRCTRPTGGKPLTDTQKENLRIAMSNKINPNAKTFKFVSPDGTAYIITGKFKQFCKEHNLNLSVMTNKVDKGIINFDDYGKSKKTFCINNIVINNCLNWTVNKIT